MGDQAVDQACDRGFSAAALAAEHGKLAALDLKLNVPNTTGMLRFFSIREGHMVNLNHPLTPPQKAICGWSRNRAKQATQNSAAIRSCT